MCSEIGCKCDRSNYCSETGFHSHFCHFQTLTPSRTNSNLLATATNYHLIFKSPSLSHTYRLFHVNIPHNIQPLQEYYIFIAIIYLIILFHMINLEILRHMGGGDFTNVTFPSGNARDSLVWTHLTLPWWVDLHNTWRYILWNVGPMSCLKPNGQISCWATLSCIFKHYQSIHLTSLVSLPWTGWNLLSEKWFCTERMHWTSCQRDRRSSYMPSDSSMW